MGVVPSVGVGIVMVGVGGGGGSSLSVITIATEGSSDTERSLGVQCSKDVHELLHRTKLSQTCDAMIWLMLCKGFSLTKHCSNDHGV